VKTAAEATPPQPPKNVTVEPSTADSEAFATRAANAQMEGNPQAALAYAERAIAADPRDPWPHYNKASALARLGNVDEAVKSFTTAEQLFNLGDVWARSVAIYGSAHALAQVGRCDEAKVEYNRYAAFIRERDPRSADMAVRYAATCRPPVGVPSTPPPSTPPPATSPEPAPQQPTP
jgi:Flp pilus assembly protein TadD